MDNNHMTIEKAIKQAAASIWIDKLPLSEDYIKSYYEKRLDSFRSVNNNYPKLILKRGNKNGRR